MRCPRCGKSWTGNRPEHCTIAGCHQTFANAAAADSHRLDGACLSAREMAAMGMRRNERDVWTVPWVSPWV